MPIHLLDNLIIPVNACKDHWFPAHLNVAKRQLRFLDSYKNHSASGYTRQEKLMWKFYRLAWTVHAHTEDPPTWATNPKEVQSPQELLTSVTEMKKKLQTQQNPTVNDIVKVIGKCTVERWGGKGVYLLEAVQLDKHWTRWTPSEIPQQNHIDFKDKAATALACGVYSVLSSMYAVRGWKADFDQQSHIKNARNWLSAACDEIGEVVILNLCRCGKWIEQWGGRQTSENHECGTLQARGK